MIRYFTALAIAAFFFVGCTGETSTTDTASTPQAETPEAPAASNDGMNEIVIQPVGDQLKFALEEFTVKSGAQVKIIMDNVATWRRCSTM